MHSRVLSLFRFTICLAIFGQVGGLKAESLADAYRLLEAGQATRARSAFADRLRATEAGAEKDRIAATIGLARSYQALNQGCDALDLLMEALLNTKSEVLALPLHLALGDVSLQEQMFDEAKEEFERARQLAERARDSRRQAQALVGLGRVLAARQYRADPQRYTPGSRSATLLSSAANTVANTAIWEQFDEGISLAAAAKSPEVELKALLEMGRYQNLFGETDRAEATCRRATELAGRPQINAALADWIACSQNLLSFARRVQGDRRANALQQAESSLQQAEKIARATDNNTGLSLVHGARGLLQSLAGRRDAALEDTSKAIFLAQRARNQAASFHWQWQAASLLREAGDRNRAREFYNLAAKSFDRIRGLLLSGTTDHLFPAREPADAFLELAELNFDLAAKSKGSAPDNLALLNDAQQALEAYKSFEVESQFLSDECSLLLASLQGNIADSVSSLDQATAVSYVIPLSGRTELLLTLPGEGLKRAVANNVGRSNILQLVDQLRSSLETPESDFAETGLPAAQELYNALVRPVEADLKAKQIQHLTFILEGELATIPMSVLHDGEKFLIERFSVANSPGLALVEPSRQRTPNPRILAAGLTTKVKDYDVLQHVDEELAGMAPLFQTETLSGAEFTVAAIRQQLQGETPFNILHLATHGEFGGTPESTYLLAHDGRITLDTLRELVRPALLNETPLELLCLSACETAKGDNRVALGLAGIALKSGARSVLATLWSVNDRSMSDLMSGFYRQLAEAPENTKAEALRQSQLKLLNSAEFSHPFHWSPAILVGNWL